MQSEHIAVRAVDEHTRRGQHGIERFGIARAEPAEMPAACATKAKSRRPD